jgi:hypothetical protein
MFSGEVGVKIVWYWNNNNNNVYVE